MAEARVPCPHCGHAVRAQRLPRHERVCPSRPAPRPAFHRPGVNSNLLLAHAGDPRLEPAPALPAAAELRLASQAVLERLRGVLAAALGVGAVGGGAAAPLQCLLPPSLSEHVALAPRSKTNPESYKHRVQQASIAGHLAGMGALTPAANPTGGQGPASTAPGTAAFVEFGAGSAFLSAAICAGYPRTARRATFFLVDRATPPQRRGDGRHAMADRSVRITSDIADLWLAGLAPLPPPPAPDGTGTGTGDGTGTGTRGPGGGGTGTGGGQTAGGSVTVAMARRAGDGLR